MRILLVCILLLVVQTVNGEVLNVCSSNETQYPYSFVDNNGAASGIHIDIIREASNRANIGIVIVSTPFTDCIQGAFTGKYDAVAALPYKSIYDEFMRYPRKAKLGDSTFSLGTVKYNVAILPSTEFTLGNNLSLLPQPVFINSGYSIVNKLKEAGLSVIYSGATDIQNIEGLIRLGEGSVILVHDTFKLLNDKGIKDSIVDAGSLEEPSYYLAYPEKSYRINLYTKVRLWKAIGKVTSDKEFMETLSLKHQTKWGW